MNAIQTTYNGRCFRSRGEARFAVFCDACQLRYVYEAEGFWLEEAGKYLPDFLLPGLNLWFEVKSEQPERKAILKCECLAAETLKRVAMSCSSPGLETMILCFSPGWSGHTIHTMPEFFMQWLRPHIVLPAIERAQDARFEYGETPNVVPLPQRALGDKLLTKSDRANVPF